MGHVFVQHPVRNVCLQFKIDRLSHFPNGVLQVFTTQKSFPSEIAPAIETAKAVAGGDLSKKVVLIFSQNSQENIVPKSLF